MMLITRIKALSSESVKVFATRHDRKFGNPNDVTIMVYSLATTVFTVSFDGDVWKVKQRSVPSRYSGIDWETEETAEGDEGCYSLVRMYINEIKCTDNALRRERSL